MMRSHLVLAISLSFALSAILPGGAFDPVEASATTVLLQFDVEKDVSWERSVKEKDGKWKKKKFKKKTKKSGLSKAVKDGIVASITDRWKASGITITTDPKAKGITKTIDFTGGSTPPGITNSKGQAIKLFGTTGLDKKEGWVYVPAVTNQLSHRSDGKGGFLPLTDAEKIKALSHTGAHEIGHVLGLAHGKGLMKSGPTHTWSDRVTTDLAVSVGDKAKVAKNFGKTNDDTQGHICPGCQHGATGLRNIDAIDPTMETEDSLFMGASVNILLNGPGINLADYDYGYLNQFGEFITQGNLGDPFDPDAFGVGSGEEFSFALFDLLSLQILSELTGELTGLVGLDPFPFVDGFGQSTYARLLYEFDFGAIDPLVIELSTISGGQDDGFFLGSIPEPEIALLVALSMGAVAAIRRKQRS